MKKRYLFIVMLLVFFSIAISTNAIERNGLWGFNYMILPSLTDNTALSCTNSSQCWIRFQIETPINVTNVTLRFAKLVEGATFNMGLQFGNITRPNGTWMGTTGNGLVNFTPTSASVTTFNRQLGESVSLTNTSAYYWIVVSWLSGNTSVAMNTFSSSLDNTLYDLYPKDLTNKSISVFNGNDTVITLNNSYARFVLSNSSGSIFQTSTSQSQLFIRNMSFAALVFKPDKYFTINSVDLTASRSSTPTFTMEITFIDGIISSDWMNKTKLSTCYFTNITTISSSGSIFTCNFTSPVQFYKDHYYSMYIRDANGTGTSSARINLGIYTFSTASDSFDSDRVYFMSTTTNFSTYTVTQTSDIMFRFNYTNSSGCINASSNISVNAFGDYHEICNIENVSGYGNGTIIKIKNTNDTATYNISITGMKSLYNDVYNTNTGIVWSYNQSSAFATIAPGEEISLGSYRLNITSPTNTAYSTTTVLLSFVNKSKTNSYNVSLYRPNGTLYHYYRDTYPDTLYSMPTYATIENGVYYVLVHYCNSIGVCFNSTSPSFTYVALASTNQGGGNFVTTNTSNVTNQTNTTINRTEIIITDNHVAQEIVQKGKFDIAISFVKDLFNKTAIDTNINGEQVSVKYWMIFAAFFIIISAILFMSEIFDWWANILIGGFGSLIIIVVISLVI